MKLHDLECTLVHETAIGEDDTGAILVTVDGKLKAWLPKKAIEIERKPGSNTIIVTAPESLLVDKELV
jgi:hypothetical protein